MLRVRVRVGGAGGRGVNGWRGEALWFSALPAYTLSCPALHKCTLPVPLLDRTALVCIGLHHVGYCNGSPYLYYISLSYIVLHCSFMYCTALIPCSHPTSPKPPCPP